MTMTAKQHAAQAAHNAYLQAMKEHGATVDEIRGDEVLEQLIPLASGLGGGFQVSIYMRGGIIQGMDEIPEGIEINVYDYDLDGAKSDDLSLDPGGQPCLRYRWSHKDNESG